MTRAPPCSNLLLKFFPKTLCFEPFRTQQWISMQTPIPRLLPNDQCMHFCAYIDYCYLHGGALKGG
jgi:hypothetical protein